MVRRIFASSGTVRFWRFNADLQRTLKERSRVQAKGSIDMGGTEAFPDLGKHCSHSSCRQLDFLPFKCDACAQVFCLDHRSYTAHKCTKSGAKDATVVICPFCASGVKTVAGEDPNATIDRHIRSSSCDPSNYDRVMNKPRCSVRLCKEVLTTSNTYHCKSCKRKVCLKHRFALDHGCSGQQAKPSSASSKHGDLATRFMQALQFRSGSECGTSSSRSGSSSTSGSSKWPRIF